jgi:hypothetical protein
MRERAMQGGDVMNDEGGKSTAGAAGPKAAASKAAAPKAAAAKTASKPVSEGEEAAGQGISVDHPHVLAVRHELSFEQNKWRYGLVIITDLPLDPKHPSHDTGEIDAVVRAVVAGARKSGAGYDVLTIRNP